MSERPRICIIDDDVILLKALTRGLSEVGYEVVSAPGAAAGLDVVTRIGAEAIVTDMNMPGISGGQLIAEARATWPNLPIVAISGSTTPDGVNMLVVARALGADAFLPKPFRAAELKLVLDHLLAEKRDKRA